MSIRHPNAVPTPHLDQPTAYEVGNVKFTAFADRIIVLEDEFRTGYECKVCGGSGKVASTTVVGATRTCDECNGKGGLLIAPDIAQRRPTTGTIVSTGPGMWSMGVFVPNRLAVGTKVIYSNFVGFVMDLNRAGQDVTLRILHESEILAIIDGHMEMRDFKSDIASFNG